MVRRATLFDLNELFALWLALTGEEAANELKAGREPYPTVCLSDKESWAIDASIAITSPTTCYLVHDFAGQLNGFMVSSAQGRTVGSPGNFLHVHQLYVRPESRAKSGGTVAQELCVETESWARSRKLTQVECDAVLSNRSLWESRGFRTVAVHLVKDL